MRSWLRKVVNSFSRKPQPAAETTWHAEDFQAAPERPVVVDPWAPEAAPTAAQEHPIPPRSTAPARVNAPAAPPTKGTADKLAAIPRSPEAQSSPAPVAAAPPPARAEATPSAPIPPREGAASAKAAPRQTSAEAEGKPVQEGAPTLNIRTAAVTVALPAPNPDTPQAEAATVARSDSPIVLPDGGAGEPEKPELAPAAPPAPQPRIAESVTPESAPAAVAGSASDVVPKPSGVIEPKSFLNIGDGCAAVEPPPAPILAAEPLTDLTEEEAEEADAPRPEPGEPGTHAPGLADDQGQPEAAAAFSSDYVTPVNADPARIEPKETGHAEAPSSFPDWDDVTPADPSSPGAPSAAWDDALELPDYDPDLSQRLGDADWAAREQADSLARQRAGIIAALLDVTSRREAEAALHWLEGFFRDHRWASTFRALEAAAQEGLDFPTLKAMAELKEIWTERPEWWVRRVNTTRANLGGRPFVPMARGDIALSWPLARSICLARGDYPPDEMIDPDWLGEWYALPPPAPGAASFKAFLDQKIDAMLAAALNEGLTEKAREREPSLEAPQRLASHKPLYCAPDGELISPVMVDVTSQRQRRVEDDS